MWWIAEDTDEALKFRAEALAAGAINVHTEPSSRGKVKVTFDVPLRGAFTTLGMNVHNVWDVCPRRWRDDPEALEQLRKIYAEVAAVTPQFNKEAQMPRHSEHAMREAKMMVNSFGLHGALDRVVVATLNEDEVKADFAQEVHDVLLDWAADDAQQIAEGRHWQEGTRC